MEDLRHQCRKTKIIVTLGKSSSDVDTLKQLILGGMDMARISDLFVPDKQLALDNLKAAINETGVQVGVMLGLRESDMRISSLSSNKATRLEEGQTLYITTNKATSPSNSTLFCNNTEFPSLLSLGDKLLIDYGKMVLTVEALLSEDELEQFHGGLSRASGMKDDNVLYSLNAQHKNEESKTTGGRVISSDSIFKTHAEIKPRIPATLSDKLPITRIKRVPKAKKRHITVVCRVVNDYVLKNSKPLHISPHDNRPQPVSYSNDIEDLQNIRWAVANGVDVVVFKQIREADEFVNYIDPDYHSFIGIQNKDSVEVSKELIGLADGCVIGRGMLALETSLSEVCRVQKEVAKFYNAQAKPYIISTQLLESMCFNSVPSRSEVNDITNAILDGCDALLLLGETAYGKHPVTALEVCTRICIEAERSEEYSRISMMATQDSPLSLSIVEDICFCAVQSVINLKAVVIICISEKGASALCLARFKPPCPVLALTNNLRTLKYLRIVRGVVPSLMLDVREDFIVSALETAKKLRLAKSGDVVVYIGGGSDSFATGDTCTLRVETI